MKTRLIKFVRWAKTFANRFNLDDPIKYCNLFKTHGCAHIDGPLCDFPNCQMHSAYEKRLEMHNHPMSEKRSGLTKDKVIVDSEFKSLFVKFDWYDGNHIIVYKNDYERIKYLV